MQGNPISPAEAYENKSQLITIIITTCGCLQKHGDDNTGTTIVKNEVTNINCTLLVSGCLLVTHMHVHIQCAHNTHIHTYLHGFEHCTPASCKYVHESLGVRGQYRRFVSLPAHPPATFIHTLSDDPCP